MVYSGHQFGVWAGQLGDGRALLIGQARNAKGELWDIQLKGAGKTPYSRFGDGRAVMRSTIREYLCSEAMAALGIPTSRALWRSSPPARQVHARNAGAGRGADPAGAQPCPLRPFRAFLPSRPARTRCGSWPIMSSREYFPDLAGDHAGWFGEVVKRTAELMAHWQAVGFAHGVMNTDNMSILGLTLDYGPFGFMDAYDPDFICNHTDEQGRYAFDHPAGHRALEFARAGLGAVQPDRQRRAGRQSWTPMKNYFGARYRALMRAKLGLTREEEGDDQLIGDLLTLMAKARADYTLSFRNLTGEDADWLALFGAMDDRGARPGCRATAPAPKAKTCPAWTRSIPNMSCATGWRKPPSAPWKTSGDIATLDRIFKLLQSPFEKHDGDEAFAAPPPPRCATWK